MGKIGKTTLAICIVLSIVFFYLGIRSASRSGITFEKITHIVMNNLREMDLGPIMEEYHEVNLEQIASYSEPLKKIVVSSKIADISIITGSELNKASVKVEGSLIKAYPDPILEMHEAEGVITIIIANTSVNKPTTSGLKAKIVIPMDFEGQLNVENVSGNISVDSHARKMNLKTLSGEISVAGETKSEMKIETVSGNISLQGKEIDADVNSVSGDIQISADKVGAKVHTTSSEVKVDGSELKSKSEITTVSGNVRINIPSGYKFDVHSVSGYIHHGGNNSEDRAKGQIGTGGKELIIETTSGDVFLQ